jgi:hypothetical protein
LAGRPRRSRPSAAVSSSTTKLYVSGSTRLDGTAFFEAFIEAVGQLMTGTADAKVLPFALRQHRLRGRRRAMAEPAR